MVEMFSDGASKAWEEGWVGAYGFWAKQNGERIFQGCGSLEKATCNEAEYQSLIHGLKKALECGVKEIHCRMDSKLVVEQANGRWRVKKPHLKPLCEQAQRLANKFDLFRLDWISRDLNTVADGLAEQGMLCGKKEYKKKIKNYLHQRALKPSMVRAYLRSLYT